MSSSSRLGSSPIGHSHDDASAGVEAEYDRLRGLAGDEARQRDRCFQQSREAYSSRDGARAKELSEEGKQHAGRMRDHNKQASEYIFRENNAAGRVDPDCIDLHGQFVEEAEEILERRIRADMSAGQTHLHAIVGRGNHSAGHVQRIRPSVERLCGELGLVCRLEENQGRIYIDFTRGDSQPAVGEASSKKGRRKHGRPPHEQPAQPQPRPHEGAGEERPSLLERLVHKVEAICVVM